MNKLLLYFATFTFLFFVACSDDDDSSAEQEVEGCTDETSVNYNSEATKDDGSCLYAGCKDDRAINYDPEADIDSNELCEYVVSREKEKHVVVLEEYTGVRCPWCPDGHTIANQALANNPDRLILVNVHTGSFATPGADSRFPGVEFQDLRVGSVGNLMTSAAQLTGFPGGSVSRYTFTTESGVAPYFSQNGGHGLGRGGWVAGIDNLLARDDYHSMNVGITAEYDPSNRKATIKAQTYYFNDASSDDHRIAVGYVESGIVGPQLNTTGLVQDYNHDFVFRGFVNGFRGDEVTDRAEGDIQNFKFEATIPSDQVAENIEFFVIVYERNGQIYNAAKVDLVD